MKPTGLRALQLHCADITLPKKKHVSPAVSFVCGLVLAGIILGMVI